MDGDPTPSQVRRAIAIGLPLIRKLDRQASALFAAAGVEMPADFTVDPYDDNDDNNDDMGEDAVPAPVVPVSALANTGAVSTVSSHALGRIGEAAVLAALREVWPSAQNVSTRPHSGDIMIRTEDGRICIEVKNYRARVPSAQVDKFRADIGTTGAIAGLFISIGSPITGIEARPLLLQYESIGGKFIPCAYMTTPSAAEISAAGNMIVQLVGAIAYAGALIREREAAYAAMTDLVDAVDGLSVVRAQYIGVVGNIGAQLAGVAGDLRSVEVAIRERAATMTRAIGCKVEDVADDGIYGDPKYLAYSDPVKKAVKSVVDHISTRTPSGAPTWTMKGAAYLHRFTGATIKLYVREAKIILDCNVIGGNQLVALLRDRPREVSIADGALAVSIGPDTISTVLALV